MPFDQSLVYVGLDTRSTTSRASGRSSSTSSTARTTSAWAAWPTSRAACKLNRDNFNFTPTHAWTVSNSSLNQLSLQIGRRKFDEPNNSTAIAEYFSSGNTLLTGANITGDQNDTGNIVELRDTFFTRLGSGRWAHDFKFGGAWQWVKDDWNFPVYPQGLMIYVTDTRRCRCSTWARSGTGESEMTTNLISGFAQDDLRPSPRVTINLGLRYDLDTNGNNPDFTSPLSRRPAGATSTTSSRAPASRGTCTGKGAHVIRGGVGLFTGRFLLVPAHVEIQQNGFTGRIIQQRINGAVLGLPARSRSTRPARRQRACRCRVTRGASTARWSIRWRRR